MRDNDEHTADQYHDHMKRIARLIAAWEDGEISVDKKRRAIADENSIYYGDSSMRICNPYRRPA